MYAIAHLADGGAAGATAGAASTLASMPYVGASGDVRARCFDHIEGLPKKGTNRTLRGFFEPIPRHERAAHAGVALVFGLNEVHPTYLDALAGGKRKTTAQAQWMLHNLEQRALGSELRKLLNVSDGAYGHGPQAYASTNGKSWAGRPRQNTAARQPARRPASPKHPSRRRAFRDAT